jgi:chaperonin GroES
VSTIVTPLADRVVAVREKAEAKTLSGLYLPDGAKEKPSYATVESVGPDVKSVKKGDKIVFKEYATTELKIADVEYLIVKEEDILAKLG